MKNRTFTTLFFCLLFLNFGCKEEDFESEMEAKLSSECTYRERETVDTFYNEQGEITFLQEQNIYTISGGKMSDERIFNLLDPCNLPESFQKDKLKVVFSGELKEVYNYEDRAAQPFKLTKLSTSVN